MVSLRRIYSRPNGRGSKNKSSKLTEEKVHELRRIYRETNTTIERIAEVSGINKHTAWSAVFGKTWRHVGGRAISIGGGHIAMRKLSANQVLVARKLYKSGVASIREIAEILGLAFNSTRLMLTRVTYRHVPEEDNSYNESLAENISAGILKRLHLEHYSKQQRLAIEMTFLAGVQHGLAGGESIKTEEEVMGSGNHEYMGCRLGFEDLQQLSHAYSEE